MILRFWIVAVSFFLIDQATKLLTLKYFKLPLTQYNTPIIENKLSIHPSYNENNIMGFFELPISPEIYKYIYLLLAIIVSYGCFWVIQKLSKTNHNKITLILSWGLGLIAGAVAGNSIDRFIHFGVFDFIQIHALYIVLNMADIFALTGSIMCLTVATYIFSNPKKFAKIKVF